VLFSAHRSTVGGVHTASKLAGQVGASVRRITQEIRPKINDPRFKTHSACQETPKSEDFHEDNGNLYRLRSLVAWF